MEFQKVKLPTGMQLDMNTCESNYDKPFSHYKKVVFIVHNQTQGLTMVHCFFQTDDTYFILPK